MTRIDLMRGKTSLAAIATSLILAGTARHANPRPHDADHAGQPDAENARHLHARSAGKLDAGDAGPDPGRAVPARPGATAG